MSKGLYHDLRVAIQLTQRDVVCRLMPPPGEECAAVLREVDDTGKTLLHIAVECGMRDIIIELLIAAAECRGLEEEIKWKRNSNGITPVELAANVCLRSQNTELFNLFFPTQHQIGSQPISPHHQHTCIIPPNNPNLLPDVLASIEVNEDVAIDMARIILDHSRGNPIHLYPNFKRFFHIPTTTLESTVSLVVLGDSGSGKSTLIKSLKVEGFFPWIRHTFLNVRRVDTHRAGIIPTHFDSVWFGKVIFYDLSSHREFIHEAILKCGHLSNAVFLIVVNLYENFEKIVQQIVYWLTFVRYHHSKVAGQSVANVIIVGSHLHDQRLGRLCNREIFRDYAYPKAMRYVEEGGFHISTKALLDCRKTSVENAMLRYALKAQFDRIRQTRADLQLPSKSYILYAIIKELCNLNTEEELDNSCGTPPSGDAFLMLTRPMNAIRIDNLLQEIQSGKPHYKLFYGNVEEIVTLCEFLVHLNLLILLTNEEDDMKSWIIPDSYPFLCEIEEAIFHSPHQEEEQSGSSRVLHRNHGILKYADIVMLFEHRPQHYNIDLLLRLMIHYAYCEVVPLDTEDELGYFFPHLLNNHLDIPDWEVEEGRFMFVWSLAPDSPYQYFMPHLIHHFLLQLSQAKNLDIQKVDRAIRTLAWANDEMGVEVVVHIHESQKLFVSMRCTLNSQLNCLYLRKKLLQEIKAILKSIDPSAIDASIIETIIPTQKHLHLPLHDNPPHKLRQYQTKSIKDVIINKRGSVLPMDHSQPLVSIDKLLFFEPYYYMDKKLREALLHPANPAANISQQDFLDIGLCLQHEKLYILLDLIGIDVIFIQSLKSKPMQPLIDIISQAFLHISGRGLTYEALRCKLDAISFFELEEIVEHYNSPLEEN